jgi:membrane protein
MADITDHPGEQRQPSRVLQAVDKGVRPLQMFVTKFNNDWSMNLAAGLAYNLIMAMFPLVIAVVAILGLIVENLNPAAYNTLIHQIENIFPTAASSQGLITSALKQLGKDSGVLGIIAILLAIFNGSRLFIFIEGCLDIIYHVRPRGIIAQNVVSILMVLFFVIIIPVMIVASIGPAFVFSILQNTPLRLIPGSNFLFSFGGILGGLIAAYILFQVIYIVVPNQKISFRHSWPGSVVAAILLEIYLALFPLFVSHFLGAFSGAISILILLVFFYYFGVLLFLGAEVNAMTAGIRSTPYDLVTMVHNVTHPDPEPAPAHKEPVSVPHDQS